MCYTQHHALAPVSQEMKANVKDANIFMYNYLPIPCDVLFCFLISSSSTTNRPWKHYFPKSRASRKGCLLMQVGCSLNFLSTAFVEHGEGPHESQVKIAVFRGDLWLRIFFFDVLVSKYFMKYKQREISCSFFVSPNEISVENQLEAKPIYLFRCLQTVWVHFYCYHFHWICSEMGPLLQVGNSNNEEVTEEVMIFESMTVILYFSVLENLFTSKFLKFKWCVPNTLTS